MRLTGAQHETTDTLVFVVPRSLLHILVVDEISRRYAMVLAYGAAFLPHNFSTGIERGYKNMLM